MNHQVALILTAGSSLVALVISIALLRQGSQGGYLPGCGSDSGCHAVFKSRWSRLAGVPVATLGVLLYGSMLVLGTVTLLAARWGEAEWGLEVTASAALGGAIWFTAVQMLVMRRWCVYCMSLHVCGSVAFFSQIIFWTWSTSAIATGLASATAFALVQTLMPTKEYRSMAASELPASPSRNLASKAPLPVNSPKVSLVGGRVELSLDEWPMLGGRNAPRIIGVLLDITCEECRKLYHVLKQVTQSSPEIAFVMVPMPLHSACNPYACKKTTFNPSACEFAQLFMTVWHAKRESFGEFEKWVMTPARPPPYLDARNKARRAVDNLTFALLDSRVETSIRQSIELYRKLGVNQLPQLLMADRLVLGRLKSAKEFRDAVE